MPSVLLVEDSPSMRSLILLALRRIEGVTVVEVEDGMEATTKLKEAHFDLVLTDLIMPVMDGMKLIHWMRTDGGQRTVPIIVISTQASEEDQRKAYEAGATAFLTKPIRAPELLEKVKELLGVV